MKLTGISALPGTARDILSRFRTLQEWLGWQEKLHFTAIELGLDRCRKVADRMHLLPMQCFVISVAGTNGKGSTAVMLENILRAAGYRVGLYTSPHLLRYNERIRINGTDVDDNSLCAAFERIDKARGNISLTYFEFGTLAAMDIFRSNHVEIAVMEVGLGGRLDAVNMIDANVSVISTVDIDHEQWLGYDRESIGREKAGIFRPMRPAICADPDPPQTVLDTAALVGANLLRTGIDFSYEAVDGGWSWRSGLVRFNRLPVPGNHPYQIRNAAGVLMVLQTMADSFPISQQVLCESLRNFRMPGRFQLVPSEVPLVLDVAHNRQSASMLATNLKALPDTGRIHLVLGMLKDKNCEAFVRELMSCVDCWYLCTLDGPRGAASHDLAETVKAMVPDAIVNLYDDVPAAIVAARSVARTGDHIIITGSFVTVGVAINALGVEI